MNLYNLFQHQKQIDSGIEEKYNLAGNQLFSKKLTGLYSKLGELVKETECYKFWTLEKPSNYKAILDKYLDCIHYTIAIGLEKGFTETDFAVKESEYDINEQILNLLVDLNDFMVCSSKDHYTTIVEDFLSLGLSLGFSESQVKEGYRNIYM